jgi:diguanylate cyclase (GGDEF)-like protein
VLSPQANGRRLPASRLFTAVGWLIAVVYFGLSLALAADPWDALRRGVISDANATQAVILPIFFAVLVSQLLFAAWRDNQRTFELIALAVGVALWAVGAASITASGPSVTVEYPAPGELWMLLSYLGIAAHLFVRSPRRGRFRSGAALDAVITFGGALCVSGVVLTLPIVTSSGWRGVPLLMALVSPTLDLALLLVIVGQTVAGARASSWASARLVAGFVWLGVGDTAIIAYTAQGTYGKGLMVDACFCLGFLLIVSGACTGSSVRETPQYSIASSQVTLLAGAAAAAVRVLRPNGRVGIILLVLSMVTLAAVGGRLLLALSEVTDAAEAHRLSRTDDLTGLPNRRALLGHLTDRLAKGHPTALLLLDLDGFKEINDTLGHAAGDAVLGIIATRLSRTPSGATITARLGGDEFALVFDDADPDSLIQISHRVRALIRKSANVDGIELSVDCSIGVALSGVKPSGHINDHRELLRRADVAMYRAKAGRGGVELYDPSRDEFSRYRLQLTQELANGIVAGELFLEYQPQVNARTGEAVSMEALIRWQHPSRGRVPPGDFLPVARRAGLMPLLTETVIRMAVDEAAGWHQAGLSLGLAINVAPTELLSTVVMSALISHLQDVGLPSNRVVVEVTEDSFLAQPERARDVIMDLRRGGVQVSIDDYGTGFSSLAYLKNLPVQEIKIDQSFVRDVLIDPRAQVIVASTIKLARGLDLRLVAEGVEDEDSAKALADLGVDLLQGYLFARPMPGREVIGWVARNGARRVSVPGSQP